jgi:hypothetical protein
LVKVVSDQEQVLVEDVGGFIGMIYEPNNHAWSGVLLPRVGSAEHSMCVVPRDE